MKNGRCPYFKIFIVFLIFSWIFSSGPWIQELHAATRTKTVEFFVGQNYGTAGIATAVGATYDFTVYLPDAITSASVIRSAYIEYNTVISAVDASATAFKLGLVGSETTLSSPAIIDMTGESTPVQMKLGATSVLQGIIQAAGTFSLRFTTSITGPVRYGENARLLITYDYNDVAATQVKTVYAWVHSQAATVATATSVTSAIFNLGLPESTITSQSAWIETRGYVNAALTTGFKWNAETRRDIAWPNTTNSYGYVALVSPTTTYSPNTNNTFTIASVTGAFSAPSAILGYTYSFDYSASTELMRSLKILLYQGTETASTATLSGNKVINIPESGITMKSSFLFGRASNIAAASLGMNAQLGSTPTTTAISFLAYAAEVTSFQTIVWDVTSNLSTMTAGDNTVYWAYSASAATNIRGLTLYLNYKYNKASSTTFNFQAEYHVGQDTVASTASSPAFTPSIADPNYILKSSHLNAQFNENAAIDCTYTVGITTTGAYLYDGSGENVLGEVWRDTSSNVTTLGSALTATLNNTSSSTKSASFLVWWQVPPLLASLGKSSDGWAGAVPVYGYLSGITNTDYPYCRAKVTPVVGSDFYTTMTWNPTNNRFEGTIYPGSNYCNGCADPNTGNFTVILQLDNEDQFLDPIPYSASVKTFSTFITRRWNAVSTAAMGNSTEFLPTWNAGGWWDYQIHDFSIGGTAAAQTNVAFAIPFHPTTASITNIAVTTGAYPGTTINPGSAATTGANAWWWDSDKHTLYVQIASVALGAYTTVNLDFDSQETDLFATRLDRDATYDMSERLYYNGILIGNRYIATLVRGGGTDAATLKDSSGQQVSLDARDTANPDVALQNEVSVDCMERVAVHVSDPVNCPDGCINPDASTYYEANIKWKQNEWANYIRPETEYQNNNSITIVVNSDDTAGTGWKQQLDTGIAAYREQTFYASKKYIKNFYRLTNNGAATRKYPLVWGREQWIGTDQALNDKGRYLDGTVDDNTDRILEKKVAISTLTSPWFMAYDSAVFAGMGVIFESAAPADYGYFLVEQAILSASPWAEWPIVVTAQATTQNSGTFFEKVWPSVLPGALVTFTFYQWGYDDTSWANIQSAIQTDCDVVNPPAQAGVVLTDTAISIANSTSDDLMLMQITNNTGWANIEIKYWKLKFTKDGTTALDNTAGNNQIDNLFDNIYIYYSANTTYGDADDVAVATLNAVDFPSVSDGILQLNQTTDNDANTLIASGLSKYYFAVVRLKAGATSATIKTFSIYVDPATATYFSIVNNANEAQVATVTGSAVTTKVAKAAYFRNYIGSASSLTTPHIRSHPISGLRAYISGSNGNLYCYNVSDGTSCAWSPYYIGAANALSSPFGYSDYPYTPDTNVYLYFGVNAAGTNNFYGLTDAGTTVSTRWTAINLGSHSLAVSAQPTIKYIDPNYNIYIGCTDTSGTTPNRGPHLHRINATDGTNFAEYTANPTDTAVLISSFSRAGSTYNYINSGAKLFGIQLSDGVISTERAFAGTVSGSPYPLSASELFVGEGNTLHKIYGASGSLLDYPASWTNFTTPEGGNIGNSPFAPTYSPDNDKVFITTSGTDTGKIFAINRSTGAEIWRYPASGVFIKAIRTQPMYVRTSATDSALNYVVVSSDDGYIYFVNAAGTFKDKGYLGQVAIQNCIPIQVPGQSKVIVGSTNGYIFCFPVP